MRRRLRVLDVPRLREEGRRAAHEIEDDEDDILDKAFDVRSTSRLGCQATIEKDGEVEVEITRESYDAYYNEHPDERPKEGAEADSGESAGCRALA